MTLEQIESELRIARRNVFSADGGESDKAQSDILRLKALAKPYWEAREKPESAYARVMWM
jgi:hypothetical protein